MSSSPIDDRQHASIRDSFIFFVKLSNATKWFCLFRIIDIRVYYDFGHHQYNDVHSYLQQICKKRKKQIKEESEYLFKSSHFCLGVGALEKKRPRNADGKFFTN